MPLFIFIATVFNFLISSYLISYLYVFLTIIGIGLIFIRGVLFSRYDYFIFLFVTVFLCFTILHTIIDPKSLGVLIKGIGMYLLFPLYWLFLFRCKSNFTLTPFLKLTLKIVIFIAIMGVVQFYISPNLWGILDINKSNNIQWAIESKGSEYFAFFRSTSIFVSPQIYGLFSILYIYIIHISYEDKPKIKFIYILICFLGSAHSGNKMSYLIFLIYLFMILKGQLASINIKKLFIIGSILLSVLTFAAYLSEKYEIGMLTRILSKDQIIEEEQDNRLEIYANYIESTNLFFGSGSGMSSLAVTDNDMDVKTSESYLLLILNENGLWYFLSFFIFYLVILFNGYRNIEVFFYLMLSILCSMIFVHAHTDPAFFVFWAIIIYGYINITKEKLSSDNIESNIYQTPITY